MFPPSGTYFNINSGPRMQLYFFTDVPAASVEQPVFRPDLR